MTESTTIIEKPKSVEVKIEIVEPKKETSEI